MSAHDFNEARDAYNEGRALLTKNCFLCRCSPQYYEAISPFKRSADLFHGLQRWDDEVKSREELIVCFRATRSFWEEGNEYEKIAKIKLQLQDKPSEAFTAISNANVAYISGRSYEPGVKVLVKASNDFKEKKYEEFSEKTLKVVFDSVIQFFHVLVLAKDDPHEYIYKALDDYLDILFINGKLDEAVKTVEQIIKTIAHDEDDKAKQVHYYVMGMIGAINFEKPEVYDALLIKAREVQLKVNSDYKALPMIEQANEIIFMKKTKDFDNREFDSIIKTLVYEFPTALINSLKKRRGIAMSSIEQDEQFNFK